MYISNGEYKYKFYQIGWYASHMPNKYKLSSCLRQIVFFFYQTGNFEGFLSCEHRLLFTRTG